jgi:hypothetical protein
MRAAFLTMNRYTHILLETQSDALRALPELSNHESITKIAST